MSNNSAHQLAEQNGIDLSVLEHSMSLSVSDRLRQNHEMVADVSHFRRESGNRFRNDPIDVGTETGIYGPIRTLLPALSEAGIEFLVIGGVAAVLHGADYCRLVVEITTDFSVANLERCFEALQRFDALDRLTKKPPQLPESGDVDGTVKLSTSAGLLDLCETVKGIGSFEHCRAYGTTISGRDFDAPVLSKAALLDCFSRSDDAIYGSLLHQFETLGEFDEANVRFKR